MAGFDAIYIHGVTVTSFCSQQ